MAVCMGHGMGQRVLSKAGLKWYYQHESQMSFRLEMFEQVQEERMVIRVG